MRKLVVNISDEILTPANEILDELGMDMQSAISVFLKRIVREESVAFVFPKKENEETASVPTEKLLLPKADRGEMRKTLAIKLFRERGNRIDKTVTYSSKNRTTHLYWSNPSFSVLKDAWSLILNDWVNRKLYLFKIPANAISASQLIPRNDQKELIDLQIVGDDPTFTDRRSSYSFKAFLTDKLEY